MVKEMKMKKTARKHLSLTALSVMLTQSPAVISGETNNPEYWDTSEIVSEVSREQTYTASMHTRFEDIKSKYEVGGEYYYSDDTDAFGYLEALNTEQEMIFCTSGDVNFTTAFKNAAESGVSDGEEVKSDDELWRSGSGEFSVSNDASTMGFTPSEFDAEVYAALVNNSNSKGRFCYDMSDYADRVDYRNASAAAATYCDPSDAGSVKSFTDSVSGYSCELELDIALKVGETRFVQQIQTGMATISQGYLGCYKNAATGEPELELVDNPDDCTVDSRESCNYTCDWADQVVCTSSSMPTWGDGKCSGIGTTIFEGDAIIVESSDASSYSSSDGVLYRGTATMRCSMVSDTAEWVISSQSCAQVTE
ncbi:hypothetical protein [Alteromonas sp. 14N.309.X.WAT.G.H12]|uniref:hypothetical protein n=1 Tax=Alteromonas sp. 14N.309.X.WAT.G.H12 TaxID=3120824 RepID=UPI002FD6E055